MDDFREYEKMRDEGSSPRQIYEAGEANGLDEITKIRMVRRVCGLSLAEVKEVSGMAARLDEIPEVKVGAKLCWDSFDTIEGSILWEGVVTSVEGPMVHLDRAGKYKITPDGLEPMPITEQRHVSMRKRCFEKTLAERLGDAVKFLQDLAHIND